MKKRLATFLAVTFGLSWGVWIPAGFITGAVHDVNSSPIMLAIVAVSMFFPLVGALAANAAVPETERIDLGFKPRIRENVRSYVMAWLVPAALALAGSVVFFLVFPQLFDRSATTLKAMLAAEGIPEDQLVRPVDIQFLHTLVYWRTAERSWACMGSGDAACSSLRFASACRSAWPCW